MSFHEAYQKLRGNIQFSEVSLGYRTVYLLDIEELEKAQVGYRIDNQGNSLTGKNNGDWQENWIVIGYEDQCGDPIFIDGNIKELPVYTAIHGEGDWSPKLIASSFENLAKALSFINEIAKDRENPVKLQNNPLSEKEKETVLRKILNNDKEIKIMFWKSWLED